MLPSSTVLTFLAAQTFNREVSAMAEELKPCPFCGGPAELRTADNVHYSFGVRIMCEPCGADITYEGSDLDSFGIKSRCIAAWNRRVPIQIRQVERQPFQLETDE